jgi:uncharacterized membrane protein (UPF0127 family)
MAYVIVRNLSRPQVEFVKAKYCDTFLCRLRGLTFRRRLLPQEGLLLVQARDSRVDAAIHMLFVWMALTVVWINAAGDVVDVRLARPWQLAILPKQPARYILELVTDRMVDFKVGERVGFEE